MSKEYQFHQVQVKYLPEEDRMLLRINTRDKDLFEYYITRRYLKLLWAPLNQVLLADPNFKEFDSESKKAVFAFEHEKKMSSVITTKPFVEKKEVIKKVETQTVETMAKQEEVQKAEPKIVEEVPDNKPAPLLFSMAQLLTLADNLLALKLCDMQGRGLTLDSKAPALHFLYHLLLATEPTTGWDLQLQPIDMFKPDNKPVTH